MEHLRLQIPLAFGDLSVFHTENQRIRQFTGLHTSTTPKLPKLEHATLALIMTSPTVVMHFRHACSPFH